MHGFSVSLPDRTFARPSTIGWTYLAIGELKKRWMVQHATANESSMKANGRTGFGYLKRRIPKWLCDRQMEYQKLSNYPTWKERRPWLPNWTNRTRADGIHGKTFKKSFWTLGSKTQSPELFELTSSLYENEIVPRTVRVFPCLRTFFSACKTQKNQRNAFQEDPSCSCHAGGPERNQQHQKKDCLKCRCARLCELPNAGDGPEESVGVGLQLSLIVELAHLRR